MKTFKALTVLQPHAWAIVAGLKPYENRSWKTDHRGLVLIHAGVDTRYLDARPGRDTPAHREYEGQPGNSEMVLGAAVGVAELVDCLTIAQIRSRGIEHDTILG